MADQQNNPPMGARALLRGPAAKRRRKHLHSLLPTRPKKPMTGYTMFLRNYFNTHPREDGVSSHDMLRRVSSAWRNLPPNQRSQFQDLCAPDVERYRVAMAMWRQQREALKRPASAYALFVKDFWQRERNAGRVPAGGVGEMGPLCRLAWANASDEEKRNYTQRYQTAAANYSEMMRNLEAGRVQIQDVIAQANERGDGQAQAHAHANANADDDDDEEDAEVNDGEENGGANANANDGADDDENEAAGEPGENGEGDQAADDDEDED